MGTLLDVAKKMNQAWHDKDQEAFRQCLHKDYTFTGPMMTMNSADEAVDFMTKCPFDSATENCEVFVEGQTLVHVFDWHVTAPFQATIPMVEVLEFEGGKVKRARLFFDSALFPAEIKASMLSAQAA